MGNEATVCIVIIVIVAEGIKKIKKIDNGFIPIINIAMGMLLGLLFVNAPVKQCLVDGATFGVIACGSFDTVKQTYLKVKGVLDNGDNPRPIDKWESKTKDKAE